MSTTPTWYDVLGVDRSASDAEVRAAWKAGTADLEPGDRRFDSLNKAARVLLDPGQRAAYDAEIGEPEPEPEPVPVPEARPEPEARRSSPSPAAGPAAVAVQRFRGRSAGGSDGVPTWMLVALAVLAVAMVVATVWTWQREAEAGEDAVREAQAAAEKAVVPVLSYDHRTLDADQESAQALLTDDYRQDYDQLFAVIKQNAPRTRTAVTAEVVSSGIVRSGEDRVDVLLFVDRPTTNKLNPEPIVYRDQVTVTMEQVDGEWLVDEMVTSPTQQ